VTQDAEKEMREFIAEHWSQLLQRIPDRSEYFEMKQEGISGFCSHDFLPLKWVHSRGGSWFAQEDVLPEGYFSCGVQYRGGSEYLFIFATDNDRRFAFYYQYIVYAAGIVSYPQSSQCLDEALRRWDSGQTVVVLSSPWGWYDPQKRMFDLDDTSEFTRFLSSHGERERPE
jgi:hypothetical protein